VLYFSIDGTLMGLSTELLKSGEMLSDEPVWIYSNFDKMKTPLVEVLKEFKGEINKGLMNIQARHLSLTKMKPIKREESILLGSTRLKLKMLSGMFVFYLNMNGTDNPSVMHGFRVYVSKQEGPARSFLKKREVKASRKRKSKRS